MKKFSISRRVLACVLAISMVLGISSTTFAAAEDLFTENTINYVSLGASNVNGYGLDGYLPDDVTAANKNEKNVFGYRQCPEGSYVDLVHDELENKGYAVNVSQLAISSMRVEELRVLLDESYYGDAYTAWRFIGPGKWFENAAVTGGLEALRADYASSIAEADLITVDIGVNNFGVYLSNQLASGGTAYDDDLSLVDPELAEEYNKAKAYVYDLIAEHAGEYSAAVAELDFAVDAMAYALAGFCVNFDIVMEKIYELNPEATVVAVSIQNLMEGLEATIPGVEGTVPFGELFGALVDAANLYIAVGSPYSDDYLFADVSENGRVEFFLEQLLAYNGNPASLDKDMRDCFDLYDEDLMVSSRVDAIANGYFNDILAQNLEPHAATLASIYGQSDPQALLNAIIADAEDGFTIAGANPAVAAQLDSIFTEINTTIDALKPVVLSAAYDVVAEIMQLGAKNNVLDLAVVLAGGYGAVEDGLLDAIENEVLTVINAVVSDPTFEYSIDEDFFNDIASAADVPTSLVNTVATLGIRTGIGNSFYGHPNRNGHAQIKTAIINALENNITGFDALLERLDITEEYEEAVEFANYVEAEIRAIVDFAQNATYEEKEALVKEIIAELKTELGITAEDEEAANEIIDEIKDIIDVAQNGTDEEKEALILAYFELLKAELGITAEDEAKVAEFAEIAVDIIDIVKNTSKEDVKAAVDEYLEGLKAEFTLEFAKLGHKHYEGNNYVAIGGDTLFGTGITRQDKLYSELVSEALGIENGAVVAQEKLLAAEVADLVMSNAQNIAAADLITYQLDASSFVNGIFSDEDVDWSKYIDAEVSELFNAVIEEATEILTADWAAYANAELDEVLAEVLPEVQAAVAEYVALDIDEEKIDAIISLGISSVKNAIDLINAEKDEAYANVVAEINGIDDMVIDFAEKIAYTVVSFTVESVKAVETIQTINPEATLLVVGMYNPLSGLEVVVEGETYNVGEMAEYVIDVTNAFYYAYAAINKDFAFVDVSDAEANGFSEPVVIADIETAAVQLVNLLRDADAFMHASAAGHVYIKDQIVNALTCDYSVYEQLDADNHTVKCSICAHEKVEAHNFIDTTCDKCGYIKTVTPDPGPGEDPTPGPGEDPTPGPTPSPRPSGGSSVSVEYTITFETNGGSAVAKVFVEKGGLLVAPANPTKEGFVFDGWYTDKALTAKYDFATPVTKSFTLYAKWAEEGKIAKFTDIDSEAWYYDYVTTIVEKGLMNGISETEFAPDASLTRGMFVTILYRVEGEPAVEDDVNFTDVVASQYYENAVKWANSNGIVKGITETEFAPDAEVTHEQMAAMFARYADYKKLEVPAKDDVTYTDSEMISEYAKAAVETANKLGVLIGNTDGSFAPKKNATRAEAAALFARLLGVLKK